MSTDPSFITALDWQRVGGLLLPLWWLFASVAAFAHTVLLAYAIVPSLGFTRELPASAIRIEKPPLYGAALFFLALAVFSVAVFINRLDILKEIFDKGLQ